MDELRTIDELDVEGERVLLRADLDVPVAHSVRRSPIARHRRLANARSAGDGAGVATTGSPDRDRFASRQSRGCGSIAIDAADRRASGEPHRGTCAARTGCRGTRASRTHRAASPRRDDDAGERPVRARRTAERLGVCGRAGSARGRIRGRRLPHRTRLVHQHRRDCPPRCRPPPGA